MPRICVFDVNETLLDLRLMDTHFKRIFGAAEVRQVWFNQLIQNALVSTVTRVYSDFGSLGGAALEMVAARQGLALTPEDRQAVLGEMRILPAHPDVAPNLARLRDAGFRLAALTNSTAAVVQAQMSNARLTQFFEQILSADMVRRLKPAPEPYRMAADRMGVGVGEMRMIAAHAWDITGALRAGCAAAFVARPGMTLDPLVERPDIVGDDLYAVVDQILEAEG